MANQEHLNIFRQGVDGWNEWRKQHPEIRPDLTRANLGDALLAMLISAKQILLRLASWGLISSKLNLPEQI